VGDAYDPGINDQRPLAEQWNGKSWSIKPTPTPSNESNAGRLPYAWGLRGVSCSAPSACTAVGFYPIAGATAFSTLAERWDGTSWTLETTAVPGDDAEFYGVSCAVSSSCTAVGVYGPLVPLTLAEQWNGTAWVVQPTPNPVGDNANILYGVSCSTGGACKAVGQYIDSTGNWVGFVEGYSPV
jgi:hypothetical protein